jgi:ATP-dependent helicase HepA
MLVVSRSRIEPDVRRVADVDERHARLEPAMPGVAEMSAPLSDLRRYRIKSTDPVIFVGGERVEVLRSVNPRAAGQRQYEIERANGRVEIVREPLLSLADPAEGAAPDPIDQLANFDAAPWEVVSARQSLIESFFAATARSMGLAGYTGARMLPIPHQINAARYALLFGRVRFLLADEVGLGKTVQAGLIAATLRKYFPEWRASIFVPESLTAQWAFEMYGKFGKSIFSLRLDEYDSEIDPGVILPHALAPDFLREQKPSEILIVDEAHRILGDPALAEAFLKLSSQARAVLLLTATPRADDAANLRRLLRLADPERFESLDSDALLLDLLNKQGEVEALVQALRAHNPKPEDLMARWKKLGFQDAEIESLIRQGSAAHPPDGEPDRHALRHAAALLVDRRYPGARILRYQRKFLARDNAMAIRVVSPVEYVAPPAERVLLDVVREWLDQARESGRSADSSWQAICAPLIQASFSSPLAVESWLEARRGQMEEREGVTADPIRLVRRQLAKLKPFDGEDALLRKMEVAARDWERASRADRVGSPPLSRLPRFKAMLRELREELEGASEDAPPHILIFTGFEANVKPLWQILKRKFEKEAEVFHIVAEQSWRDRERAAFAFQECLGPSILVSDELGGEGRNFQFVTTLFHFDLPLAPWLVEQRVGRCDRVGRDEDLDVDSRVLMAKGKLDEAIFEFLAEGVNVFNESIAPVENALSDAERAMIRACLEKGSSGVLDLIEPTRQRLDIAREEEERDLLARGRVGVEEARRVAVAADDAAELAQLRQQLVRCARLFDSMVDERPNGSLAITVGEHHTLRGRSGVLPEMIGYASRRDAVRHERLEFFSPGHPFARQMAMASLEESVDRAAIIERQGLPRPAFLFLLRMQADPDLLEAINELPVDLRAPLFCQSAASFGTTFFRAAFDFEGNYLSPDDPRNEIFYRAFDSADRSLDEGDEVFAYLPDDWTDALARASDAAAQKALDAANARLEASREDFENLLCEVLSRVFPTQEWLEERVGEIMPLLEQLIVEFDSAVALFPPREEK